MEDLTLAIVTVGSFALLFLVAIFADKAGAALELPEVEQLTLEPVPADELAGARDRAA